VFFTCRALGIVDLAIRSMTKVISVLNSYWDTYVSNFFYTILLVAYIHRVIPIFRLTQLDMFILY